MSVRDAGHDPAPPVHVFTPYRRGLPNLRTYLRDLWERRQFALELSRTQLRAQHVNTLFGQIWLVINPLLLTLVYFLLVTILTGGQEDPVAYLAHIMAGLFVFYYFSGCLSGGASSVVGGGRLILNTAFPKALLPLAAVLVAARRFLPTLVIYGVLHVATGRGLSWAMLWGVPIFVLVTIFSVGCSLIFATANVYFRDTQSFLPYVLRIWLYLSPILWFPEQVPESLKPFSHLNPLFSILGSWSEAVVEGRTPDPAMLLAALGWALAALLVGSYVFLSREREFAVRI
jgi:ABC-type polysaccharide/polyol phosphate export permease